jgi:hypothetical protein
MMEAAVARMFVMFERTPLTGFITPPDRAKRAVAAAVAGLAAGGWTAVSSSLRALTAQCTCNCRVLLSVFSLEYPHDLKAWRIFTFMAGSGFCSHAKKKPQCLNLLFCPSSLKTSGDMGMNHSKTTLSDLAPKTMKSGSVAANVETHVV